MLNEETIDTILKLQQLYPEKRSALIPALHVAQNYIGYLPLEVQQEVADLFEINVNEVQGIVTFYDMFFDEPIGKHILHVCKNLSCMLRGGDEVLSRICEKLQVAPRKTTEDGEFTVIPSECLGACDRAPMMLGDDKVYGNIDPDHLDHLLEEVRKSPGHPCPYEHVGGHHA